MSRYTSGWRAPSITLVLGGALALATLGLVAATPFVLSKMAPAGYDWGKLGNISQVYGSVSILISTVALAGVVLSLVFQLRQTRTSDEQSVRDNHLQLTSLVLGNPELLRAWSPPVTPVPFVRHQQHIVASLALGELLHRFRIGHLSADKLTVKLNGHFRHEIAREQWQREGPGWLRTMNAGDRRDRIFVRLAQDRYEASVAAGPPVAAEDAFLPSASPGSPSPVRPRTRPRPPPHPRRARLERRRTRLLARRANPIP